MVSSSLCASRCSQEAFLLGFAQDCSIKRLENLCFCFNVGLGQLQIPWTSLCLLLLIFQRLSCNITYLSLASCASPNLQTLVKSQSFLSPGLFSWTCYLSYYLFPAASCSVFSSSSLSQAFRHVNPSLSSYPVHTGYPLHTALCTACFLLIDTYLLVPSLRVLLLL